MTKRSTPPFFNSKKTLKNITLLTYLLLCPAARVPVTSLRRRGMDIWHRLQQSAVDSATDGERVFAPAYGPKEVILSSDNMLVE